ncbi:putative integral membrane protein [Colletotrichum sublineola]|uniref:Putative integral membrane protein n=1 Tax=Colletotrichum sublineola TaxID=1173701 RepID=A0A066WXY1_COLSU|nr:putative integral membrane protein [Colletotrichum sublineola]
MSAASQRGSLVPLPEYHRRGLIILTSFSFLSAVATSLLWLFITYKFLSYRKRKWVEQKRESRQRARCSTADLPDLSLGLDAPCRGSTGFARIAELDRVANSEERTNEAGSLRQEEQEAEVEDVEVRSPFPILVYNLLLADMMEAVAYALSIYWVVNDGIIAPSSVCWAQGWLGSTSNLAASLFLLSISVYTFLTVGLGYKPPPWTVYTTIAGLWIFDFGINGAGVIASVLHPATPHESFFMRANVWCWISSAYDSSRLWAHYFWIMVSIAVTITLYAYVFFTLWREKRSCRHMPGTSSTFTNGRQSEPPPPTGYHPAFVIYPFVYIGCSVPLVVGRVASLLGIDLGIYYFSFAGSVLAANGLINSILWMSTILFSAPQDVRDTGLDQFAFVRTPVRNYGHTVVISGPVSRVPLAQICPRDNKKDWWWWRHGGQRGWGRSYANMHNMPIVHAVEIHGLAPPAPVEGPFIQMEVVTAVTTEQLKFGAPTEGKA